MLQFQLARLLVTLTSAFALGACQAPFYGTSANGHNSAPRGWNSFVAQSNGQTLTVQLMDTQCGFFYDKVPAGFDYVCSFDSGWSVGDKGDDNGRMLPEPSVFNGMSIQQFAQKLHSKQMKLGVYLLPGAFTADAGKVVKGTSIKIGSLFNRTVDGRPGINNEYNLRNNFIYSLPGVQDWHDSVVELLNSWGVDFIKLDFVTPGSDAGTSFGPAAVPADSSGSVIAYHKAIQKIAPHMRLDLSWRLDREQPFWNVWQNNADTLRLDRDINFGTNPVDWSAVQRTVETYRQFINQQVLDSTRQGKPIMIHPDMDNLMTATPNAKSSWSGLSTVERYAQTILWIGAGANLINGCDMTQVDQLGQTLLTNSEVLNIVGFTTANPMVPKLPGTRATQLQAWISGPKDGVAVVILTNIGPDLCRDGCSFKDTGSAGPGTQLVKASYEQLGIAGKSYFVRRVLGGGGQGGSDFTDIGKISDFLASNLEEHESVMYKLTECGTNGVTC